MAKDKKKPKKIKKIKAAPTPKPDPHELLLNCTVSLERIVHQLVGVTDDLSTLYKEKPSGEVQEEAPAGTGDDSN